MSGIHIPASPAEIEIRHFHLFCGLGGGAKGFNRGRAQVGPLAARFRCIGGVDVDPASIADFERAAGVRGTVLDMFDRDQFMAFHGKEPPPGWREATPQDLHRAAGGERPHVVFLSAPCKGFSGLLSETASRTGKYQALNRLTLRGVWLMLEAWADDPPEFILFENVPRIMNRGRPLLDRIDQLLRRYGYAVAETTHDCGALGNLGQSRKRFLLVARHAAKVPPFLYEPPKRPLRGVGEILERFPMPGHAAAGPMHRMPSLQWKTWVRLAFVEAGSDWRSLNRLRVEDGVLADYGIEPGIWRSGPYGVRRWDDHATTIAGESGPSNGSFSVADPRPEAFSDRGAYGVGGWDDPAATLTSQRSPGQGRFSVADPRPTNGDPQGGWRVTGYGEPSRAVIGGRTQGAAAVADPRIDGHPRSVQMGVRPWDQPAGVVTGQMLAGGGPHSVADPRVPGTPYNHVYRIVAWGSPCPSVTSANGGTAAAVADPRTGYGPNSHRNKLAVVDWDNRAGTVTGSDRVGSGALSVADPRPDSLNRDGRDGYLSQGHYGVVPWEQPAGAVPAFAKNNNGRWSVADPRDPSHSLPSDEDTKRDSLPAPAERLVAVIRALDGTWHRPFTTLELAALQGLVEPEEHLRLEGLSDSAWRERIGNAVPPPAAEAIASVIGRTLLLAWTGETFTLSAEPIWVQPIAAALSVRPHRIED